MTATHVVLTQPRSSGAERTEVSPDAKSGSSGTGPSKERVSKERVSGERPAEERKMRMGDPDEFTRRPSRTKSASDSNGGAEAEPPQPMSRQQQRRLFASARSLGLTDAERLDLSEVILRRDVPTWKDLTEHDAGRLIDAFDGYEKITWLLLSRDS